MTDDLGTLAGLIADLENAHFSEQRTDYVSGWKNDEQGVPHGVSVPVEKTVCAECVDSWGNSLEWPCPTIELTRKHKQAQRNRYVVEPALFSRRKRENLPPGTYSVYAGEPPGERHFTGTKAECEAWIDRQVNGE